MSTDPLLPGFDYLTLHTAAARLRVAVKGSGPPLLLLHGYPQTHLAWHRIAACRPLLRAGCFSIGDVSGLGKGWLSVARSVDVLHRFVHR